MTSCLVIGANRGLGLALVSNLASHPATLVVAAACSSFPELRQFVDSSDGRVVAVPVELVTPASIAAAVQVVEGA